MHGRTNIKPKKKFLVNIILKLEDFCHVVFTYPNDDRIYGNRDFIYLWC